MTNSILARQRWAVPHFFLTTIISSLLDVMDLKKTEMCCSIFVSSIWSYGERYTLSHKVIDLLCTTMNLFDQADKERLYNIVTGKAASVDTEQFLLSVNVRGEMQKQASSINT